MTSCTPFPRASNSAPPRSRSSFSLLAQYVGTGVGLAATSPSPITATPLPSPSCISHCCLIHSFTAPHRTAPHLAAPYRTSPRRTALGLLRLLPSSSTLGSGLCWTPCQCLPPPPLSPASPSPSSSPSFSPPPPSHPPRPPVTGLPVRNIDCRSRPAWSHATRMATRPVVN